MKRITLSLLIALLAIQALFSQGTVMPAPRFTAFDNNGLIIAGGKLCTFAAGTTTQQATYSDSGLTTPNTNPVVMDSAGRAIVYLSQTSYKFTLYSGGTLNTCDGTQLWSQDNISAIPTTSGNAQVPATAGETLLANVAVYLSDGSGGKNAGQWYRADSTNAYSSTSNQVGMTTAGIASGAVGTVRIVGQLTGLGSLTIGSLYYVGTAGAITATPPAMNARTIGQADTTTSLIVGPIVPTVPTADNAMDDGRCSLTTLTPVTTANVTAATTVFFTPYKGNRIALFDGTATWNIRTFTELSIAVPATTSQMYDLWVFDNAGTPALEALAWTSDTTRAPALVLQNGVLVKTGVTTRRYVCSFRTTTVSGQTEDSLTKRYVWNYYNRVRRPLQVNESTASWNYTTATIRQANGSTANQLALVQGWNEAPIDLLLQGTASNANVSAVSVGIGEDSTTTFTAGSFIETTVTSGGFANMNPRLVKVPSVGFHFYSWNEWSQAGGTTTFYGPFAGAGGTITNGLSGYIEG